MADEQQSWFRREKVLLKEIERLQEIETESDLRLVDLADKNKGLERENEKLKKEAALRKTRVKEKQKLMEFVNSVLAGNVSEREVYGYISRYSEENPFWNLFLVYDGFDGEKYCGGHYHLNSTDTEDLLNIFSIFSNLNKKIIVNTEGYYF